MAPPRRQQVLVASAHGLVPLSYMEWGPREAAQTVVCVHGLSRNGRDFDVLAERLAAQGVRVAAPDLPGRGASGWLTDPDDYALPLYLGAMTTLLARLNASSVDWVGTSLGGFIGMHIAADPRSPIRRLVLNDFGAKVSAAALHRIGSYVGSAPTFADRTEAEVYFRRIHAPFGALSDAHWQHIVQHSVVEMPNGRLRLHYDPRIGKQFDWPFMLDLNLWHVWEKVTAPVLLLRGAQSDLFPARVAIDMTRRGAAAQAGRVQLVEFPDCGHAPSLMAPDHIAPVLRFLAAQDVHDRANASAEDIDVRGNVLAPKSRVA